MTPPENRTPIQDRAIRLFSYLQELVQLRTPQVRDIESYEAVLWFSEIPHEEGCYSISWGAPLEDSDVWVEVKKRKEPPCPPAPAECTGWVDPSELRQSDAEPKLKERVLAPASELENQGVDNQYSDGGNPNQSWLLLSDRSEVRSEWERYLNEKWRPWAERHRRWKSVQSIYGRLFTILQLQRAFTPGMMPWLSRSLPWRKSRCMKSLWRANRF